MPENITILGDGAMATVCSILLSTGGHRVTMWGAFEDAIERLLQNRENRTFLPGVSIPAAVHLTANEQECFAGTCSPAGPAVTTLVVSAVPAQYVRRVWQRVGRFLPRTAAIVSVAKGIETESLLRPSQVIADVLGNGRRVGGQPVCDWPMAVLSGPNIAAEIARYLPATSVVAAGDVGLAKRVQAAFTTEWFRVYTNEDVVGVELAGAVKNVVAIAAGIVDGLGAGSNAKAALVTRGLVEITRLGVAMGAQEATFSGLAGLGDLITTCISLEGRNRHVGEQIGKGRSLDDILGEMASVAEGVPTTKAVRELAVRHGVEMPITDAVHAVLFEGKDVLHALSELMSRGRKAE